MEGTGTNPPGHGALGDGKGHGMRKNDDTLPQIETLRAADTPLNWIELGDHITNMTLGDLEEILHVVGVPRTGATRSGKEVTIIGAAVTVPRGATVAALQGALIDRDESMTEVTITEGGVPDQVDQRRGRALLLLAVSIQEQC